MKGIILLPVALAALFRTALGAEEDPVAKQVSVKLKNNHGRSLKGGKSGKSGKSRKSKSYSK